MRTQHKQPSSLVQHMLQWLVEYVVGGKQVRWHFDVEHILSLRARTRQRWRVIEPLGTLEERLHWRPPQHRAAEKPSKEMLERLRVAETRLKRFTGEAPRKVPTPPAFELEDYTPVIDEYSRPPMFAEEAVVAILEPSNEKKVEDLSASMPGLRQQLVAEITAFLRHQEVIPSEFLQLGEAPSTATDLEAVEAAKQRMFRVAQLVWRWPKGTQPVPACLWMAKRLAETNNFLLKHQAVLEPRASYDGQILLIGEILRSLTYRELLSAQLREAPEPYPEPRPEPRPHLDDLNWFQRGY